MLSTEIIEKLLKEYQTLKNAHNTLALSKWCPEELLQLTGFLPENSSLQIRMWHVKNRIWSIPICEECDNTTKYNTTDHKYQRFCGKRCSARSSITKSKHRDTIKALYGTEHYFQSLDYRQKARATSLERYGTNIPAQSEEVQRKKEQTNMERYGCKSTFSHPETQQKIKNTLIEKYGVDNVSKNPDIMEKIKASVNTAYKNNLPTILEKRYQTNMKLYGRYDPAQMHIDMDSVKLSYNRDWLIEQNQTYPIHYIAKKLGMGTPQLSVRFKSLGIIPVVHQMSTVQRLILDHLQNAYTGKLLINDRSILNKLELDIVIPKHNLAIEVNGIYWHGELSGKSENYHLNKTLQCARQNIRLVHICEIDIINKLPIIQSKLDSLLGLSKRINANILNVTEIPENIANKFHSANNLQEPTPAVTHLAVVDSDNMYMCISVVLHGSCLKIIKLTTLCGYIVDNGLNKLIIALSEIYPGKMLRSYIDLRWENGIEYKNAGFKHIRDTNSRHWYVKNKKVQPRSKFKELLPDFDPNLTEWQNMINHGWDRIWDCGNAVWQIML